MVLHMIRAAVCALLVIGSSSVVLRGQPTDKDLAEQISSQEAEVQQLQAQLDDATGKDGVPSMPAVAQVPKQTVKPKKPSAPQTEADKLEALSNGLKTIHNLRAMFKKDGQQESPMAGAEKFANGAMSEELSNQDSQVWSTIESMLGSVQQATKSMKGKKKADRDQIMASLEGELDGKATVLGNVTADVSKKQQQQDEEYLLGLLILHQKDWSMDKQLNATQTFMHNSPVLRDLFEHHDASKPLAPQLAVLMDAEPSNKKSGAGEKKATGSSKPVAASTAAHLFIQLTDEFHEAVMTRDCPYCAAQCVDKCHQAGNPYVQCLTDCADAGKDK